MVDQDEVFGASTMRLSMRQWLSVAVASLTLSLLVPRLWFGSLRWDAAADYRIPYAVSKDYALYRQHLTRQAAVSDAVFVVGDSVVWGEYVGPSGTLSHFLSARDPQHDYVNAGINGLFPLALEGLIQHYGQPIRDRQVVLHCNLLWMSSPEADLSVDKERVFNHVDLVPQLLVDIPCYRADLTTRFARAMGNQLPHLQWVRHLQVAHFDGQSIPAWTLQDDGRYPASYPHAYENPFSRLSLDAPREDRDDPQRGSTSTRHRSWVDAGRAQQTFAWVTPETSLQWKAFQRLCHVLTARGNRVFVVVGPFNEHMVKMENRSSLDELRQVVRVWLEAQDIPFCEPAVLPSDLYGDASHPLTEGYDLLAERLLANQRYRDWIRDETRIATGAE